MIGLIFLLGEEAQRRVLHRIVDALEPDGRLLFNSSREECEWMDTLTGHTSLSLGVEAYARHLEEAGLLLAGCEVDEGGDNYLDMTKLA